VISYLIIWVEFSDHIIKLLLTISMRPTNLSFRSPKEATGDFVLPEVTTIGTKLNLNSPISKPSFSQGKRFSEYTTNSRKTEGIGPGSYDITAFPPIVKPSHNRSKTNGNPPVSPYRFYNLTVFLSTYQRLPIFRKK